MKLYKGKKLDETESDSQNQMLTMANVLHSGIPKSIDDIKYICDVCACAWACVDGSMRTTGKQNWMTIWAASQCRVLFAMGPANTCWTTASNTNGWAKRNKRKHYNNFLKYVQV